MSAERLHLGLIAPEFPPELGGMAEFARGLATALAALAEVTVFTHENLGIQDAPFAVQPVLARRPQQNLARLQAAPVDAWLALNAGYVPVISALAQPKAHLRANQPQPPNCPLFAYLHGNDFLNPWIACGPHWLEAIRRPYWARIRHALRRQQIRVKARQLVGAFVNSQNTGELVAETLRLPHARIAVCPPGVHDAFFQTRPAAPPGSPLRLLTVSRLTRYTARKNVDGVLQALALLPNLPVHYTVVGDGDDRPRLAALAGDLGIASRVSFRGSLRLPELLSCYREADLFILASKATAQDVEGFGIVYLEASAAGVPVICSQAGGATDAVVDGQNGLLIPSSEPAAIAAGIERFLRERNHFPEDQVRGFAESFRWPAVAEKIHAIIRDSIIRDSTINPIRP